MRVFCIVKAKMFATFPPQRVGAEFHATEGEPFLAQVLQRGADVKHRAVDAEEAVNLTTKQD